MATYCYLLISVTPLELALELAPSKMTVWLFCRIRQELDQDDVAWFRKWLAYYCLVDLIVGPHIFLHKKAMEVYCLIVYYGITPSEVLQLRVMLWV